VQSSRLLRGGRPSVAARARRVTRGAHSSCVLSHTSPHRSHVRPTTFCCIGSSVTSSMRRRARRRSDGSRANAARRARRTRRRTPRPTRPRSARVVWASYDVFCPTSRATSRTHAAVTPHARLLSSCQDTVRRQIGVDSCAAAALRAAARCTPLHRHFWGRALLCADRAARACSRAGSYARACRELFALRASQGGSHARRLTRRMCRSALERAAPVRPRSAAEAAPGEGAATPAAPTAPKPAARKKPAAPPGAAAAVIAERAPRAPQPPKPRAAAKAQPAGASAAAAAAKAGKGGWSKGPRQAGAGEKRKPPPGARAPPRPVAPPPPLAADPPGASSASRVLYLGAVSTRC
jgi:hypothetical protein